MCRSDESCCRTQLARAFSRTQHEAFKIQFAAEATADTNAEALDAAAVASNHSRASAAAQMSVFHPNQFVDPKRSAAAVRGR
jgi:hypothetical protein